MGGQLYRTCGVCHGVAGEGVEALGGPRLVGQNDWYLALQLRNYRSGTRGVAPGDAAGEQMRIAALALADDSAVRDVVAHINTLSTQEINR
jgi:cytochrome c oxidase subunit 2